MMLHWFCSLNIKIKVEKFVTNIFVTSIFIFSMTPKTMRKAMRTGNSKIFKSNDSIYA